jgi:type II secretory pathway pseudopilin PulG
MNSTKGFTLVEIVVALGVSMIMLFAIGMAIESMQRSSTGIERKVTAQEDVRAALELMAMEIRMASYNPTAADNIVIWRDPSNCSSMPVSSANRGIQVATANSIAVEMDIAGASGDGDGDVADSNEIISYNYVATGGEQYITRETNCGGAQPFLGDLATSVNPRTVRVINAALGIPMFRYYDGQGIELLFTAGTGRVCMPGCAADIRAIEITLAVETNDIDPNTKQRRNMIYSTREVLRNNIDLLTQ